MECGSAEERFGSLTTKKPQPSNRLGLIFEVIGY
jgi:hypothetical protein